MSSFYQFSIGNKRSIILTVINWILGTLLFLIYLYSKESVVVIMGIIFMIYAIIVTLIQYGILLVNFIYSQELLQENLFLLYCLFSSTSSAGLYFYLLSLYLYQLYT